MILRNNNISQLVIAGKNSLIMRVIVLCFAMLIFIAEGLNAQMINNTGAQISVSNAVVFTKDLENTAGTLGNNGTINMNGYLFNSGSVNGNGFYNLKGNWTDNGSFNGGTSTVTLYGTANQTITHNASGETFYNLIINNPGSFITQISLPGGTLGIQNDLTLTAGTLTLDPTTAYLNIGGMATIGTPGSIIYNGSTIQTATIVGNFTGSGTLDMSTNNLSHFLNLGGALNSIGTFSPGIGSSTVNYNGTVPTQTVFAHTGYRNLIISNSGVKILQGSSNIGIDLTISGGTFDLGTTTTTVNVTGNTAITGAMSFNTGTAKTVTLSGNLSGTGAINMNGTAHAHLLNLNGSLNSIGGYSSSGSESTVNYLRPGDQTVFTSENYRNLSITGSGLKTLNGDVAASGILTMSSGDINSNGNTLKVTNPAITAINRTSGKVIGKLQREIGVTGPEYLYPIGSTSFYNPLKIAFHTLTQGPLIAQFKNGDIGTAGLPLDDDGNEIYDRYTTGYWTLTAVGPMTTASYSVNLNHAGFTGVDLSASIIKRTNGGPLELDGSHGGVSGTEITRTILENGISATTTDLAIGKGRPRITVQPENIDICEMSNAFFEVTARGRGTLTYQWQVKIGSGIFTNISNNVIYGGATTDHLTLTAAPYSMNGYLYRCIITDAQNSSNITDIVLLTVNLIPSAVANPASQNECPGVAFTTIALTSYSPTTGGTVPGTTFAWTRTAPAGITTTMPLSVTVAQGDQIAGTFTNSTDAPITVTFTITPTGPGTTYCVGPVSYAYVTVNPTPRVFATPQNSTQCDSMTTSIILSSPSSFTSGSVTFRYTVTATGDVGGYTTTTTGLPNGHTIADKLVNLTDVYQIVTYRVVPVSPVGCAEGPSQEIKVTVNPTPRVIPVNLMPDICPTGASPTMTQIVLTSPTVMTDGVMRFDYTVTKTDGSVIGNTSSEVDRIPGYTISYGYANNSDTIKSVYYTITPKNNAICVAGPKVVSEVKVHARPLQSIVITKPLTCSGGAGLAALSAIISKGANPYQVAWDGPVGYHKVDSLDIANLSSGKYIVKVTDNLGCFRKDSVSIVPVTAKASIQASIISTVPPTNYNITCIGSNDGTILVSATGGITPPYEYWVYKNDVTLLYTGIFTNNLNLSDPSTFKTYTGLGAGSYTLVIRDINGCENLNKITFRVPPPIVVSFTKSVYPGDFNVSCKGYDDGSAWIKTISGGRGGYTYRWFTNDGYIPGPVTNDRIDNLVAGKYYLETKDFTGCVKIDSVTIIEPEGMLLESSVLSHSVDGDYNISCDGGSDGKVEMTISGGSGNYIYSWTSTNGFTSSTKDISGLKAGVYTCVVSDVNGCILTPSPEFTLTDPEPLAATLVPSTSADGSYEINCNGGTGSVVVSVSGGSTGNYTYDWSTSDGSGILQGQRDQLALTAGTYYLTITDMNTCIFTDSITLTQPPVLELQLVATNITCQSPGFDNGSINLTVNGGAGTYTYAWSNGTTNEDVSGLTDGSYQVTVTYNNVCSKTDAVQISLPQPLTYTKTLSEHNEYSISCFGLSDGSISITPTSGLAPFIYTWTGPDGFTASTSEISGLKAGVYNLLITDSNYCTANETFTLTEPGELSMLINLSESIAGGFNINCAGDSTGSIGIEPINNVRSVIYLWYDGVTTQTRSNLPAGEYSVVITDENYCRTRSTITLTEPDSLKLNYSVTQPFCPDKPDGEIRLNVTGGVSGAGYTYKWSDNSNGSSVSNILRGFYKISVTDMNGCVVRDSMMVEPLNETCLIIPNAISPNDDLINDEWNIGMIELYPLMEIRVFNRWGETVWRSEKGYTRPWDGKSNGVPLPVDSYHYIIDLHNGSKLIVGNITIVR